ncbi:MAG: hypothetical protein IH991_14325 [Planctomycetes bacterium]|nr:hypothetical protein [Planctomycetota bacterium]
MRTLIVVAITCGVGLGLIGRRLYCDWQREILSAYEEEEDRFLETNVHTGFHPDDYVELDPPSVIVEVDQGIEWQTVPVEQRPATKLVPVASKKLPTITTTYDIPLLSWPMLAGSTVISAILLIAGVVFMRRRQVKDAQQRTKPQSSLRESPRS